MKAEDLRTKTVDELDKLLLDTRKEQFNLRFQKSGGARDNTSQMRTARRDIARIKTFLTQKNGGAEATSVPVKAAAKKAPTAVKAKADKPAKKTTTKKAAPKKAPAKKSA